MPGVIAEKTVLRETVVDDDLVASSIDKGKETFLVRKECNELNGDSIDIMNENGVYNDSEIIENGKVAMDGNQSAEDAFVADSVFTVQIECSGVDLFNLQVVSNELVQEIHQILMDRDELCHRTCFSLQANGITLDNFAELKMIDDLKEGSVIKVVEEPYTIREARIHLRHLRDLLKCLDPTDSYNGVECMSVSCFNVVSNAPIPDKYKNELKTDDSAEEKSSTRGEDVPLDAFIPLSQETTIQCLRVLTYSGWNPPPGSRKLYGDLLYLEAVSLENKNYHITASTRGFYVNQSTGEAFNPRQVPGSHVFHALADLLSNLSPSFKKNFASLIRARSSCHPYERLPVPSQVYTWLAPPVEHTIDYIRAEDTFSTRLGHEEHLPGQTREWNEEIQSSKELPKKTLSERILRERTMFKVHNDFVNAATRGAMAVVDGAVMPINPAEEPKYQMFLWSNIFFSLGFDVKDHYKDFGGDYAAHVAPTLDLQGVRALNALDSDGLYTLGTVVVDYRGYRVTAQSIIPGILDKEQEQSVVYGSIDFGKTISGNEEYLKLLEKPASLLRLQKHSILNDKGKEVELYTSQECKGIVGNDGRHYLLDLMRTSPPDVNYMRGLFPEEDLSEALRKEGFPRNCRHGFPALRQELCDAFVENCYFKFIKLAACRYNSLQREKKEKEQKEEEEKRTLADKKEGEKDEADLENAMKLVRNVTDSSVAIGSTKKKNESEDQSEEVNTNLMETIKEAANSVGSFKDDDFVIAFNPDVYLPHVKHAHIDSEVFTKEKKVVCDAANFLVTHVIPELVTDLTGKMLAPRDSKSFAVLMHDRGINMRYLGYVAQKIEKSKNGCPPYLKALYANELLQRGAKHMWRPYLQSVESACLAPAIAHFLNCLLCSPDAKPLPVIEELKKQKKKFRRNKVPQRGHLLAGTSTDWQQETARSLWRKIKQYVQDLFCYNLSCDSMEGASEDYGVSRTMLLRAFCLAVGLQLHMKDYNLRNSRRAAFSPDDVRMLFPVVKSAPVKSSVAYEFFASGKSHIEACQLSEGFDLLQESQNLFTNVYGPLHPEVASCLRVQARLHFIRGQWAEALSCSQRVTIITERVEGPDATAGDYCHTAHCHAALGQVDVALKLLNRSRYLTVLACGMESHPDVALVDCNLGLILLLNDQADEALTYLCHAHTVYDQVYGKESLKAGLILAILADALGRAHRYRESVEYARNAHSIYEKHLGKHHPRCEHQFSRVSDYTAAAVKFATSLKHFEDGQFSDKPKDFFSKSVLTVNDILVHLNAVNGIVFQLSDRITIPLSALQKLSAVQNDSKEPAIKDSTIKPTAEAIDLD